MTLLVAGAVPASGASADRLLCSPGDNGGHLVAGVCVLPAPNVGVQYEGFIITSNNSGGVFRISAGALPPGLAMPARYGASGTIVGGTPTQQGTFTFTVRGTDDEGQPLQQTYRIAVGPPAPLHITFPSTCCPAGAVGQSYAQSFFADGGVKPYTWTVISGQLPPGLKLSTSAPASVSGTPTAKGTFHFTVEVSDSSGRQATEAGHLAIT
jgi:hypothetical protein